MTLDTVLYDEEAAGKYIGGAASPISTRTMQRWRLEGIGPVYVKLGRLVRYRRHDLDAFLEERTCTSTSMATGEQNQTAGSREFGHV